MISLVLVLLLGLLSSVLLREGRAGAGWWWWCWLLLLLLLLRESLDWVREVGRWGGGGALLKLDRGSEVWFEAAASGRRCDRWFVKRLRRTEEVEVVLGA
jgi:hypothetical protein